MKLTKFHFLQHCSLSTRQTYYFTLAYQQFQAELPIEGVRDYQPTIGLTSFCPLKDHKASLGISCGQNVKPLLAFQITISAENQYVPKFHMILTQNQSYTKMENPFPTGIESSLNTATYEFKEQRLKPPVHEAGTFSNMFTISMRL